MRHWPKCALLTDGSVRCWGDNRYAELGLGDTAPHSETQTPQGKVAVALALGQVHSCALFEDGYTQCWGENSGGQLGLLSLRTRFPAVEMTNSV